MFITQQIKSAIFKATNQLKQQPDSGQIEASLTELNEGQRYLVEGNYKIEIQPDTGSSVIVANKGVEESIN